MIHSSDPRWIETVRVMRIGAPLMSCFALVLAVWAWADGRTWAMWLDIACAVVCAVVAWINWRWFKI